MAGNESLQKAKSVKDDEFYTELSDIEEELRHYKNHFKDKIVLCNCDDPYESNFFKYFAMNFNSLGLKKLIATGYVTSPIIGTELNVWTGEETDMNSRTPYVAYINEVPDLNGDGRKDLEDVKILLTGKHNCKRKLKGNIVYNGDKKIEYLAGDFRSEESLKLLGKADIVVTNPPFSIARQYFDILMEHKKQFLIIGDLNWITYKNVFPFLKDNLVWTGYNHVTKFKQRDGSFKKFGNKLWFTNLDIKKRHQDLILYKKYNSEIYPFYDNYDAIEVGKVTDIPCDYDGVMGVPVSFFEKFHASQFEILGATESEGKGFSCGLWKGGTAQAMVNGKRIYKRLFIRRR